LGGVAPVLDRRQGSVTNAKTSVRGGGEFAVGNFGYEVTKPCF